MSAEIGGDPSRVHKDTIAVALADAGKRGEVREHGKIANTPAALKALMQSWLGAGATAVRYEAALAATASSGNWPPQDTDAPWSPRR